MRCGVESTQPTDAELRAVIGPKADYYVSQWHGTATRSYNWAAFLLSGLWIPFRRMYWSTAIFYGVILADVIVEEVILHALGRAEWPRAVERVLMILPGIVCGVFGNRWYVHHLRRVIAATRSLALPEEEHLRELAARGGTRVWHALGAFSVLIIAMILFVISVVFLEEA
jgi:hypothetical protein